MISLHIDIYTNLTNSLCIQAFQEMEQRSKKRLEQSQKAEETRDVVRQRRDLKVTLRNYAQTLDALFMDVLDQQRFQA